MTEENTAANENAPRTISVQEVTHQIMRGTSLATVLESVAPSENARELAVTACRASALSALDIIRMENESGRANPVRTEAWNRIAAARALMGLNVAVGEVDVPTLAGQLREWQTQRETIGREITSEDPALLDSVPESLLYQSVIPGGEFVKKMKARLTGETPRVKTERAQAKKLDEFARENANSLMEIALGNQSAATATLAQKPV